MNSRAVVADVLWQAAVKTAVRLQLCNQFPGRNGDKRVLSQKKKRRQGWCILTSEGSHANTTLKQLGANKPQSMSFISKPKQLFVFYLDVIQSKAEPMFPR